MDNFRKIITIPKSNFTINRNDSTLLIGSCFSENIGSFFQRYRFNNFLNPQGVLFNPLSITKALSNIITNDSGLNQLYFHNEIWHSWQHNSSFSNTTKSEIETAITNQLNHVQAQKNNIKTIIVTLGTAWAYRLKSSGNIVANCHKVPAELFEKVLLTSSEITSEFKKVIELFPKETKWIFTVSPVRHWKDGVRENNVSKGILQHSIHQLLQEKNVFYFPSYEIVLDELRDYRFYSSDMLHPNELAINYIWQRFSETFFDTKTIACNHDIEKIIIAQQHKPNHPTSTQYQNFLNDISTKKEQLKKNYGIEF